MKLNELLKVDLDTYTAPISPVRRGNLASEYDDFIADYTKVPSRLSHRLIPTYSTKDTHGKYIFAGLCSFLRTSGIESLLDLGCGRGELLLDAQKAGVKDVYGVTIHIGEVKEARKLGLKYVVPADMRRVDEVFEPESLDCVVAYQVLQYISDEEKVDLALAVHRILKRGGYFIVINYYGEDVSDLPSDWNYKPYERRKDLETFAAEGSITILQK